MKNCTNRLKLRGNLDGPGFRSVSSGGAAVLDVSHGAAPRMQRRDASGRRVGITAMKTRYLRYGMLATVFGAVVYVALGYWILPKER